MARSVTAAVAILLIIGIGSVGSYLYIAGTIDTLTEQLEEIRQTPDIHKLEEISDKWEDKKLTLMFIINHRDIENISISLIRAKHELLAGRENMAVQEIDVSLFLMEELIEREKLSPANIF